MTRRAPLPKITECVERQKTVDRIGGNRLLRGAYPFFVICVLCLGHIHLQFARVDMLMQQSQLQGQQRMLLREQAVLERKNEAVDYAGLEVRARRENMQELQNPTSDLLAKVPQSLEIKYSRPLLANPGDIMVAELRAERRNGGWKQALLSFLEGGRAVASVHDRRP